MTVGLGGPEGGHSKNAELRDATMASPKTCTNVTLFDCATEEPLDDIKRISGLFHADPRETKISLGIGVIHDPHTMAVRDFPAVQEALGIVAAGTSGGYLPPTGLEAFAKMARKILLGDASLDDESMCSVHTLGGTNANALAFRQIARMLADAGVALRPHNDPSTSDGAVVAVTTPTWGLHRKIPQEMNWYVQGYPYYNIETGELEFEKMKEALQALPELSVVQLDGPGHNPTGMDLSLEQLEEVASICVERNLIPFIDVAYLGLKNGLEEDRKILEVFYRKKELPLFIAQSFSKNMSLYNKRVGALHVRIPEGTERPVAELVAAVKSHLAVAARLTVSNPSKLGAEAAALVISDSHREEDWMSQLDGARRYIIEMRTQFCDKMGEVGLADISEHLRSGSGIFGMLRLNKEQMIRLREEEALYGMENGRINFAALREDILDDVVGRIVRVVQSS